MWQLILAAGFGAMIPSATSFNVTAGSTCEGSCNAINYPKTASDAVCTDTAFLNTTDGKNFRDCINCEVNSNAFDKSSGESDVGWALCKFPFVVVVDVRIPVLNVWEDNIRSSFASCTYDQATENGPQHTCSTACASIEAAIEVDLSNPIGSRMYSYCSYGDFTTAVSECEQCYRTMAEQKTLADCKHFRLAPLCILF